MNFATAGGVTMDIGCYPLSWVRHLTGQEPATVTAHAETGPPYVDLLLEAELTLANGLVAHASGDMRASAVFTAELTATGSEGTLRVSNPLAPQMGHKIEVEIDGRVQAETLARRSTFAYQLDAFIDAVQYGTVPLTDAEDAVHQMRLIDQCYEAAGLPLRGTEP